MRVCAKRKRVAGDYGKYSDKDGEYHNEGKSELGRSR